MKEKSGTAGPNSLKLILRGHEIKKQKRAKTSAKPSAITYVHRKVF